jgi:class 3 adenylate cyclase
MALDHDINANANANANNRRNNKNENDDAGMCSNDESASTVTVVKAEKDEASASAPVQPPAAKHPHVSTATAFAVPPSEPPSLIINIRDMMQWEDLGRPCPAPTISSISTHAEELDKEKKVNHNDNNDNDTTNNTNTMRMMLMERNASLLEQLLSEALRHDATTAAATAASVADNDNDDAPQPPPFSSEQQNAAGKDDVLSPALKQQLHKYVSRVATHYHPVGFHSFEHASHVMLSAAKLVAMLRQHKGQQQRLNDVDVDTDTTNMNVNNVNHDPNNNKNPIHNPWLHFAIAFAALLHDVDHRGIPNRELEVERDLLSKKYSKSECMSSYAEWNSVDIGWGILMEDNDNGDANSDGDGGAFRLLRNVLDVDSGIDCSGGGGCRLQDMVRDLILCTDIASKERRERGMSRWKMAFPSHGGADSNDSSTPNTNTNTTTTTIMKAKAIADQIMQVADVSHTMQRWETFLKWNRRLYCEVLAAYQNGRSRVVGFNDTHPAHNWYKSEIGFFDFYIIPLAERLGGVTVSSVTSASTSTLLCGGGGGGTGGAGIQLLFDDIDGRNVNVFAALARKNRDRWIQEGKEVTRIMVQSTETMALPPPMPPTCTRMVVTDASAGAEAAAVMVMQEQEHENEHEQDCDYNCHTNTGTGGGSTHDQHPPGGAAPAATANEAEESSKSKSIHDNDNGNGNDAVQVGLSRASLSEDVMSVSSCGCDRCGRDGGEQQHQQQQQDIIMLQDDDQDEDEDCEERSIISQKVHSYNGRTSCTITSTGTGSCFSFSARAGSGSEQYTSTHTTHTETSTIVINKLVDAVVPRILVTQILNSIQSQLQRQCTAADESAQEEGGGMIRPCRILGREAAAAAATVIARYRKTGSIHRYRGCLLFIDISGFTNLAQKYPIEDFKSFINEYFTKIIHLVLSFGGEVVKFAGDALYALWPTIVSDDNPNGSGNVNVNSNSNGPTGTGTCTGRTMTQEQHHRRNVAKCTSCGIAINDKCNNYKVSKSYNRRRSSCDTNATATAIATASMSASTSASVDPDEPSPSGSTTTTTKTIMNTPKLNKPQAQDHVMYSILDKGAEYEDREARLSVHCGISEGIMAGVDIIAAGRAEFFLIGKPLTDVATAENLAGKGELVISLSVYECLKLQEKEQQIHNITMMQQQQHSDNDHGGNANVKVNENGGMVDSDSRALSSQEVDFALLDGGFYKVIWSESDRSVTVTPSSINTNTAHQLVEEFVTCSLREDEDDAIILIQEEVLNERAVAGGDDDTSSSRSNNKAIAWQPHHTINNTNNKSTNANANNERKPTLTCQDDAGDGGGGLLHNIQQDIVNLLECHRHEATRDNCGTLSAELRRVAVIFIKINYEPTLSMSMSSSNHNNNNNAIEETDDSNDDEDILEHFQTMFQLITDSIMPRNGQIRQFISDDKGTVCIVSFGLRGSVTLNAAATAIDVAQNIQRTLLRNMDAKCSIGITLGKVFCGETGSLERYEYSILGPPVNLSARLMAKGWPAGSIFCDEEIRTNDSGIHTFHNAGMHQLKGYKDPVPFYTPVDVDQACADVEMDHDCDGHANANAKSITQKKPPAKLLVRQNEIRELVEYINPQQHELQLEQEDESQTTPIKGAQGQPRAILVSGLSGTGKTEFITGVLEEPIIQNSMVVLQANHCYHDSPFYCWIPIITKIVLGSGEVMRRLSKMKKLYKRSSLLSSLLGHSSSPTAATTSISTYDDLVPDELTPFLSLLDDFIFRGFPVFKKTDESRSLKDDQKVTKCLDVLTAVITRYLEHCKKTAIISIHAIDDVDDYSKRLIQRLFNSKCKLIFIGSIKKQQQQETVTSPSFEQEACTGVLDGGGGHFQEIFGCTSDTSTGCKTVHLEYLSKDSIFHLFKWSLRDVEEHDLELLDTPSIVEKVHQVCGGIPRFAVELAHAFNLQWKANLERLPYSSKDERRDSLAKVLQEIPAAKIEELICFRVDLLSPETQLLLKVASVAGFAQYSFSQNLLETLVLSLSNTTSSNEKLDKEEECRIPMRIGSEQEINKILQGDNFDQHLDSLLEQNFLTEINHDMGDASSMDTELYRFVNENEQLVINGLMLEDQKRRAHFEVAEYYSKTRVEGGEISADDHESQFSFELSLFPTLSWQMLHITALHYDLAGAAVQAMLHYYDSGIELARLGVRDRAHGSLLSAYLMLEKRMHDASSLDTASAKITEEVQQRRRVSKEMLQMIGDKGLPASMQMLTQEHLRFMFSSDIDAFVKCITMLTKFGQSVGTIEKEGYKFGSDIYLQAIYLMLLALKDTSFRNMRSRLIRFLGPLDDSTSNSDCQTTHQEVNHDGDFCIADLTVSFPAFSGLLTFYRDSPIPVNRKQEAFLANLFVAFTEETNESVHVLRTKCILSHLYLKHGDVKRALHESESIKNAYDHDEHSLQLVKLYGMDWALICIGTMASIYVYRGEISAAFDSIHFLEMQFLRLDEFASSTKAMVKQIVSSTYIIIRQFDKAAAISHGIAKTPYSYFYKPSGILQEGLAKKLQTLYGTDDTLLWRENAISEATLDDCGVLSILSSEDVHVQTINHKRSMLYSSIETLSDRGIEAINAAICVAEIEMLEKEKGIGKLTLAAVQRQRQMQYCQSGLAYLEQSLCQKDANSDEKRTNYLSCLYQKAELLLWHGKLQSCLNECDANNDNVHVVPEDDWFQSAGADVDAAALVLRECQELSDVHDYPFMLLLVGMRYVELGVGSRSHGEQTISLALERIEARNKLAADHTHAVTCLNLLRTGMVNKSMPRRMNFQLKETHHTPVGPKTG